MRTLTRADVARRLRKSIATVRRLEHRVLFPVRDEHGVHRFDESDVEWAQRDRESMRRYAKSRWFEDNVLSRPRKPPGPRRRSGKGQPTILPEQSVRLANDLQSVLGALILRVDHRHLNACGFDAPFCIRAFDVVRRLRAVDTR